MAHALSLPSNALLQVNSPWRIARVFPKRLLNSKSRCARQSLNTPRDFLHAILDPTQQDTQDVRRHLRRPSKSSVDFNWTARIAHTSCAPFTCQSGVMAGPSCQVLTCHNTRNVVLMLLVLSMACHIKPCSCHAMPRPALPMPSPITSCHFVPCNVSLAVGVCYAPSQRNASQQMRLAGETSTTEHSALVVAPCHINHTHSRNTPVPDISVCCSFFDRRKRATLNTVKNTTMSTIHIRLILLPSPEAHARVLAQLVTTCHNRRLQHFCERHGASGPIHSVVIEIQFCEGAVCLGILANWKHQSQRARTTACHPVVQERSPASFCTFA